MRWPDTQRGGPPRQGPPRTVTRVLGAATGTILPPDLDARERTYWQRRRWHAAWLAHQLMPLDRYYASAVPPHLREPDGLAERLARLEAEVAELRRRLEGGGTR